MVRPTIEHDVKDMRLAEEGVNRIEWAAREMPVVRLIRERFGRDRPLAGLSVAACVARLKRYHYAFQRLHEILTARITASPMRLATLPPLVRRPPASAGYRSNAFNQFSTACST